MSDSRIRTLIADDHELVRLGIKFYLMNEPEFEVVGEASNGLEAYNKIVALQPDIAILDLFMPKLSGFEICRKFTSSQYKPRFVLITALEEFANFWDVWDCRADAFLLKDIRQNEFINSLRKVISGEKVFSTAIFNYMISDKKSPNFDFILTTNVGFSELQYEILTRRMKGKLFPEIARDLQLTNFEIANEISIILDSIPENRLLMNFGYVK